MTHGNLVAFLVLALSGCLRAPAYETCHDDADCGIGGLAGRCESGSAISHATRNIKCAQKPPAAP